MRQKNRGRDIDGFLLLDKPLHLSSNAALQRVKNIYFAKKAGHTGSLDPLATGMLPICFGEATKFSQFLLDANKSYRVTAQLGIKSTTCDNEGEIILTRDASTIDLPIVEKTLEKFRGEQKQIPSMFSAIKFQGKPLYELARKGIEIEREARDITIYELVLENFDNEKKLFTLFVKCSKGTYIRNLVDDIGEALGCGAVVSELRRTNFADFIESEMIPLTQLDKLRD
jgi:tRNA pseudouridine55 synthase